MKIETVDFYFFSGTGNTLIVVKKMQETFQEKGILVKSPQNRRIKPGRY
jgi:hypothetical protein